MSVVKYRDEDGNIKPFPQLVIKTTKVNITVDDELSDTSTNPVQNKVITSKVNEIDKDLDDIRALTNIEIENILSD